MQIGGTAGPDTGWVSADRRNKVLQGTSSTLTRGEVRGGGRKPYRQKGTGSARQGSIRTPLKVHGGVVFGPKVCVMPCGPHQILDHAAMLSESAAICCLLPWTLNITVSCMQPRDWSIKMNRKERRLAYATALNSAKDNITVVADFQARPADIVEADC